MGDGLNNQLIGWYPKGPSYTAPTLALSAAATWLGMSFLQVKSLTLNAINIYVSAVNGILTNIDCSLCADASGVPNNTPIETVTKTTGLPTGAGVVQFSGFTTVLSANTRYWLVFKNNTAIPGTNYLTYQYGNTGTIQVSAGSENEFFGWSKVHTINSGTAWASSVLYNVCGLRLDFSDSSYSGNLIVGIGNPDSTDGSYGVVANAGVKFTAPLNVILNVIGVSMLIRKFGTPTGNLSFKVYNNTTLRGQTGI